MRVKLIPLFPIHIGTDKAEVLSPLTDYFVDRNGNVCYVDHRKLEKFLASRGRDLISRFVDIVQKQDPNARDKYTVYNFLRDNGEDPYEFVLRRVPVSCPDELKTQQIYQTVKNDTRPYIPGSSIKGAIRTALLFHRIKGDSSLKAELEEIIFRRKDKKDRREEICKFFGKITGSFVDDVFKFLVISDTTCFSEESLKIYHSKRINLRSSRTSIPLNYEAILPNGESVEFFLKTTATERDKRKYPPLSRFSSLLKGNELDLFGKMRAYFVEFFKKETDTLWQAISGGSKERRVELEKGKASNPVLSLYQFYGDMYSRVSSLGRNEAIIFLGRGKTFFNSTVSMLLSEEALKALGKKEKIGVIRNTERLVDPFPSTRTVFYDGNKVGAFGFAKISVCDG